MRFALALVCLAGCSATMDGSANGGETCEGPLGPALSISQIDAMTACCFAEGGEGHCMPNSNLPSELMPFVAACDSGSSCIPDNFLKTGASEPPASCTAFGGDGVCLSICIPQVNENSGLLRKDTCAGSDELCVPCISPLDNMPTGACDLRELATCDGGGNSNTNPPANSCDDPNTCNYEASCPPVLDPAPLTACAPDAHCVDAALVPAGSAEQLAKCADQTKLCVPDIFIETGGKFTPPTCRSVNDAEGRCLSLALPDVKSQEGLLPQSTCAATERCTPCYSPIDGMPTGACSQSCDVGPTEPAKTFTACCEGRGKCVAATSIPDDQEGNLDDGDDACVEDVELCVPDQILNNGPFTTCTANSFILGNYTGVCLSDCLEFGLQGIALARGSCMNDHKCAPCTQNGQPTGAPGCPP
jgi:hypothetical protein